MSVNQGVTMTLRVTLLFLLASCAAIQSCSEVQCKLLPLSKDVASKFQLIRTSEKDVRMIYLQLKIGNGSYDPLQSPDEFLPYRWVWAPTISELLLSLSYDYDILSLGLLKRQVRSMDVQLEDEPSGCLAALNPSCKDTVVARTLLGNVTARKGPGSIHSSKDVVCVAEIDTNTNFFENFFEGDVEFRCCKVVDQGGRNLIPECDLRVQKSNWYKAFYVVLNVFTLFVGFYSPALLFLLPDYMFDLREECEKERKECEEEHKQDERLKQNGYQPIPSSQETHETITEESINVTDADAIVSEQMMLNRVRRPATLAEDHIIVIEEPNTNDLNANEANGNEANLKGPNSNEPNLNEPNSDISLNSRTNDKGKDEEEERKIDEMPVDDGTPVNISTLLYACASAKVFRHYSTKLSFNIKLAFLWVCVIPFFFYIELALGYILKDEYLNETGKKDAVFLTGGLFILLNKIIQTSGSVILITLYFSYPLLIILILRPEDLSVEPTRVAFLVLEKLFRFKLVSRRVYIGDLVLHALKKNRETLLKILLIGKAPIHVYQAVQNSCNHRKQTGARRLKRLFCVLLALISSIFAVIFSVIIAAICLLLISFLSTIILLSFSPYSVALSRYFVLKLITRRRLLIFVLLAIFTGFVMLLFSEGGEPLLIMFNPCVIVSFTLTAPFFLSLSSCQFVIKMWGYTIMGLIYNAEIAAPIAVFFVTLASYLRDRYFDSKNKCKRVKETISQEWQQGIKKSLESGKLNEQEKPKVVNDAIPKKLFRYVCDSDEYQEFPLENEALRLLRDVVSIFFTALLALFAIFFSTNSYKISTVASTIAVFVSAKIPMVLLRETDNFNGWKKIKTKRIIRESVTKYIDEKRWLEPANEAA